MEKPVQLLLPLKFPDNKIQLPSGNEEEVVIALASLLLQILKAEEGEEVEDEPCT